MGPVKRSGSLGKPTWSARLRTFGWVAFITVLIFVWADLEQTKTESVRVRIVVVPPANSDLRIIEPDPQEGIEVAFRCRGPQGQINQFLQNLRDIDGYYYYNADPDWEPGKHPLVVEKILNQWDLLRKAHLQAESPQQETIQVAVDRWVPVTARVKPLTNKDDALEGPAVANPEKVRIRVPQSRYDEIKDSLEIETERVDFTGTESGEPVTRIVRLKSGIKGVEVDFIDPPQVTVTAKIGRWTKERTLEGVSVQLAATPELLTRITNEGYVLSRDPRYRDEWKLQLTVSGPRKDIERLDPAEVRAFVRITASDLEPTEVYPPRPVTILLPQGITVSSPSDPEVHFKFVKPDQQ